MLRSRQRRMLLDFSTSVLSVQSVVNICAGLWLLFLAEFWQKTA
jgi:hypothetical protein